MSRVAKQPISLPKGVELTVGNDDISVKGPKGKLSMHHLPGVSITQDNGVANISLAEGTDDKFGGTARALLANLVKGVSEGYERKLELVGVGYRAAMQGKSLNLSLGYSHPVLFDAPEGISLETPTQTEVVIKGSDKQVVGQVAAIITLKEAKKA